MEKAKTIVRPNETKIIAVSSILKSFIRKRKSRFEVSPLMRLFEEHLKKAAIKNVG